MEDDKWYAKLRMIRSLCQLLSKGRFSPVSWLSLEKGRVGMGRDFPLLPLLSSTKIYILHICIALCECSAIGYRLASLCFSFEATSVPFVRCVYVCVHGAYYIPVYVNVRAYAQYGIHPGSVMCHEHFDWSIALCRVAWRHWYIDDAL